MLNKCLHCNIQKEEVFFASKNICKECRKIQIKQAASNKKLLWEKRISYNKLNNIKEYKTCIKCKLSKELFLFRAGINSCIPCEQFSLNTYRKENIAKVREIDRKNKAKPEAKERRKKYREINYFKEQERQKKYRQTPEGLFISLKNSAIFRKLELGFTKEQFLLWYSEEKEKNTCYYCKRTKEECLKDYAYRVKRFTFERKDNSKGYVPGNIVLSCSICNEVKSDIFTEEQMLTVIGPLIAKNMFEINTARILKEEEDINNYFML
jgi:hypothetical protein